MTTLDRYLLRSLLLNYLLALGVMMSLYAVLDLFFNIDEFTESGASAQQLLHAVGTFYAAHVFLYFSQLSGVIALFACLVTLARMRRANELTAVLASGVSLYRVGAPVIAFGVATSLLWYVNTEFMLPRVAHKLARSHDDATGLKARGVWFVNDGPKTLLSARRFTPAEGRMEQMLVMHRDDDGSLAKVTEARVAQWESIPGHARGGVWRLTGGVERQRVLRHNALSERLERPLAVYESALDPAAIEARQSEQWLGYLSTRQLTRLTEREPLLAGQIRHAKHTRFATPLVHMLMLLLGLPFFLSREPANIINDAGKCLIVCGLCFLTAYASMNFVKAPAAWSALPAWLTLIIFAPVSAILVDRIRT